MRHAPRLFWDANPSSRKKELRNWEMNVLPLPSKIDDRARRRSERQLRLKRRRPISLRRAVSGPSRRENYLADLAGISPASDGTGKLRTARSSATSPLFRVSPISHTRRRRSEIHEEIVWFCHDSSPGSIITLYQCFIQRTGLYTWIFMENNFSSDIGPEFS